MVEARCLARDVFTPTTPARATFVERESINDRLVSALHTPGKQIVVYGHSGSGKSTLIENKLCQPYENHVTTRCVTGLTFDQVVMDAFDQLNTYYLSETVSTRTATISAGLKGEYAVMKAEMNAQTSFADQNKQQRTVSPQLTPRALARLLGEAQCCWVLEDFHKMEDKEKAKLAQVMKVFMDMSDRYSDLKIIAIGAVDSARQVVEYDSEMRNRVAEIYVRLMNGDEIRQIVEKGEKLLNFSMPALAKDGIVHFSSGLAGICHQLCLNMCFVAGITETLADRGEIDKEVLWKALELYLADASDTLKATFDKALRRSRVRKFDNGRLIAYALTTYGLEGATHSEILTKIRKIVPDYPAGNLTSYLKHLTEPDRGEILRHDPASGRYAFADPIYLVYASVLFEQKDAQLPLGPIRSLSSRA